MDPRNGNEALWEVALDLEEGADMVMIKPWVALSRYPKESQGVILSSHVRLSSQRRVPNAKKPLS